MLNKNHNKFYINDVCFITITKSDKSVLDHTHDFLELVYIFNGNSVHYVNGAKYELSGGDMLFINIGSSHRFEAIGELTYANVIIKPEFASDSLKETDSAFSLLKLDGFKEFDQIIDRENCLVHFVLSECRRLENLIYLAYIEQARDLPGKEIMLNSIYNTILTLVFRKMSLLISQETTCTVLLRYIRENCGKRLTLEQIALENNYSPAYFSRLFKKQTGCTFTSYLQECRCELACKLLTNSTMKIDDIATEVGFSDRTKFFKAFFAYTGTTPKKYRSSKYSIQNSTNVVFF